MNTAVWLIQEVVRTEQRLHENNMDDFIIKVHMTKETKYSFLAISPAIFNAEDCNKLRGHEVIIGNTNSIEIVKEL